MRRRVLVMCAAAACAAPMQARGAATLELRGVVIVGRAAAGAAWADAPTEARLADGPELAVVGVAKLGGKVVYVADDGVAPLVIGGKQVGAKSVHGGDALDGDVRARWSAVEPHAWREEGQVAPSGTDTAFYSNVVSGGAHHGEWLVDL
jgi:hypothetical protein